MAEEKKAWDNSILVRATEIFKDTTSLEEVKEYYENWATKYDQDLKVADYKLVDESMAKLTEDLKKSGASKDTKILDIGAGTGKAGKILKEHGYHNIDGLDFSQAMLDVAMKAGIYKNALCFLLSEDPLPIDANTYDVVLVLGCIGQGHIRKEAFKEIIRLTKKDGLMMISIDLADEDYVEKLEEHEKNGLIKIKEKLLLNYIIFPHSQEMEK